MSCVGEVQPRSAAQSTERLGILFVPAGLPRPRLVSVHALHRGPAAIRLARRGSPDLGFLSGRSPSGESLGGCRFAPVLTYPRALRSGARCALRARRLAAGASWGRERIPRLRERLRLPDTVSRSVVEAHSGRGLLRCGGGRPSGAPAGRLPSCRPSAPLVDCASQPVRAT